MDTIVQVLAKYQRPVCAALAFALLAVGVFVPAVSADKLWVLAGLTGLYWGGRTAEKFLPPKDGLPSKEGT